MTLEHAQTASPPKAPVSAVHYLPLVHRVARRLGRRLPAHVSIEDLISAGVVGLLEAMQRFDPARATQFSAYAEFRIKGAILDELRRGDMMARDARSEVKRIEATIARLTHDQGGVPSDDALATAFGCSLAVLHEKFERLIPVRISSFDEEGARVLPSGDDPFEQASRAQVRQRLVVALDALPQRQRQVLYLYYIEELTLRHIGEVMKVSESRICQIMSAATLQLRVLVKASANRE
jgi:RNA polymerase sigma factor for flagellar operon FliA